MVLANGWKFMYIIVHMDFFEKKKIGVLYPIIIGQLISLIGTSIQSMAIPLYILQTTGSGLLVSVSQMITVAVTVIVSPIAGVAGDRYNRKRLLVGSDLVSFAVVLALFVLFSAGVTSLPFIFLCQALCAASECLLISSLFAIIPDLVAGQDITKANAIRSMGSSVALFMGPMLGGVLYGFLGGIKYIFLINALSFLVSALLACALRYRRTLPAPGGGFTLTSFVNDLKEIMTYLQDNATIRRIARFAVILNMTSAPILYVIIPYLIVDVVKMSSQQYGLVQGLYMAGFFAGGVLLSTLRIRNMKRLVRPSLMAMSAATLLLSLCSLLPIASAFSGILKSMALITCTIIVIGCGDSVSGTIVQSEIQSTVRPDIISRIGGVINMTFQVSMELGLLIVGLLIDHVPLYWVFIPIALFLMVFTALGSGRLFTGPPTVAGVAQANKDATE
jgi:MFS family permease